MSNCNIVLSTEREVKNFLQSRESLHNKNVYLDLDLYHYPLKPTDTLNPSSKKKFIRIRHKNQLVSPNIVTQNGNNTNILKSKIEMCFTNFTSVLNVCKEFLNRTPPCVIYAIKQITDVEKSYEFRFFLNCFIFAKFRCGTCNNKCIVNILSKLYRKEKKAEYTKEAQLMSNKFYMPRNCDKLRALKICQLKTNCADCNNPCAVSNLIW